ncbi:MAG: GTPase Era [Candidatus Aminicenantaceae bacterium]
MKVGYAALIGRPNVGKSTLLNNMLGQKVAIISNKPQTTRTSILGIKTTEKGQIIFVDNPGIHKPLHNLNKRMMNFVYSSLETSDLINLLIDATEKYGHGDRFVIDILKNISTPIILLINKVDIVRKDKILLIIDQYKDLLSFKEIIPISALKGTNVNVFEDIIYENLPEAEKIYSDDEISDQSQRFLLSEIIREKLLRHVEKELPFSTAVYIDTIEDIPEDSPPNADSAKKKQRKYINAHIFVEKETHRRIIIGKQGRMIKKIGTQARLELVKILDARIYLDLWVKVKENWRDAADVLDLIERQ